MAPAVTVGRPLPLVAVAPTGRPDEGFCGDWEASTVGAATDGDGSSDGCTLRGGDGVGGDCGSSYTSKGDMKMSMGGAGPQRVLP